MLTSELSPSVHISEITVKGHQRANAILRCFETRDRDLLVRAFVTYIRTLMEYNSFKRSISKTDFSEFLKYDVWFSLFYYFFRFYSFHFNGVVISTLLCLAAPLRF